MKMSVRKLVLIAILTSMAFVVGLVESFIPSVGIPGVKLGLSNIVILVTLYELGIVEAFFVSLSQGFIECSRKAFAHTHTYI